MGTEIQKKLFDLQDADYREFHSKLMPSIDPSTIIGVRTPDLRKYGREIAGSHLAEEFLLRLPHDYYEENNLHGILIEQEKEYDKVIYLLEEFLPYVDNWATCDMTNPKVLAKNLPRLQVQIREWVASPAPYTIRFGIGMLMRYYLEDEFSIDNLDLVAGIQSEEYYVKMMIAWFFATALAKQYEAAVIYLQENRLSTWVHNKTIQKAVESNRISLEQKKYLRTLRKK